MVTSTAKTRKQTNEKGIKRCIIFGSHYL